uniref:hypothetical protein n=1 Tax=Trichocoleus desertorum TaxID=1481672 RepID=UPI0025B55C75|nr:hypothetical protein [Trichocoleus desertorum]
MSDTRGKVRFTVQQLYKRLGATESSEVNTSTAAVVMSREAAIDYKVNIAHDLYTHDLLCAPEDKNLTSRVQELFTARVIYFGKFAGVSLYQISDSSLLQPTIVKDGQLIPLFPI